MQTQIGYVTDPSFRYIDGWAPTHKYYSFLGPDDAVHRAALDVLQHTEVIGGDILLKRAHQNRIIGPHRNRSRRIKATGTVRACGGRRVRGANARTSAFTAVSSNGRVHSQNERYENKRAIA
jgi:hypothetical protein